MFNRIFADLYRHVPEVKLAGVWGRDGLELEKRRFAAVDLEMDLLGAEVADVMTKFDRFRFSPDSFLVKLDFHESWLYVYKLTAEFFLIVLCDKTVLNGKINFYVDLLRPRLTALL